MRAGEREFDTAKLLWCKRDVGNSTKPATAALVVLAAKVSAMATAVGTMPKAKAPPVSMAAMATAPQVAARNIKLV
jgi:hypothetical protein